MTGYRVAESPDDPLAIDEALCRRQRWNHQVAMHILVAVFTAGLWLPVLIGWLVMSRGLVSKWASAYAVRIRGGALEVGNAVELRSVPLDTIGGVRVHDGLLTVSLPKGNPDLSVLGLRDPIAASQAILEARDAHVRAIRGDVAEALLDEPIDEPSSAARKRRAQ